MAKRKYYRKTYKTHRKLKIFFFLCNLLFLFFILVLLGFFLLFIYYAKDLPRPEKFTERPFIQSTKIYDRTGEILLYDIYGEEKRTVVPLDQIPTHLIQAVVSLEDANFYNHFGLDLKAIGRAVLSNLKTWGPSQGASTISQQLIRSSFLTRTKTLERKIKEVILTIELERKYSKDQIMEFYLNQVPFGSNAYGVEAASQTFFKKSVSEASLAESAALVSMIKAPTYYSPYGNNLDSLLARKNYTLNRMASEGYITREEVKNAQEENIEFTQVLITIKAPHFVLLVKQQLEAKYGKEFLKEKGLKIYTTLDWGLQQYAEQVVLDGSMLNKAYDAHNAALVSINPQTGEILSMVGSKDWFDVSYPEKCISGETCLFDPKVNMSIHPPGRQPGSAFKPIVYVTAFQKGYDDEFIVIDEETSFGIWGEKEYIPQNYDEKFRGEVTLREALSQSLNVPSVKVLVDLAGIEDSIKIAHNMGITTLNKSLSFYGPSLVLGGGEVKLLDIVSAYGTLATEGLSIPPVNIFKIEDSNGNVIEENKRTLKRVLETKATRLINDILSDNEARSPMFGDRSNLYFEDYIVSAKTGTTSDFRDAWTVGYTSSLVTGVWVGNSNNSPMMKKPAVVLAGSIWHIFMEEALQRSF